MSRALDCTVNSAVLYNILKNYLGPSSFLGAMAGLGLTQVLGLVGTNGIGKSTALKILAGKLKPNLGRFESPPDWQEILQHFRGSELQNYFTRILEDNLKVWMKDPLLSVVKYSVPRCVRVISRHSVLYG